MTDIQALQRTLGERLVKIRTRHGMTQQQMADKLGIGKRNLVRYENDQIDPPLDVLKRYATTFDVPLAWIIEEGGASVTRPVTLGSPSKRRTLHQLIGQFHHPSRLAMT